MDSLPTLAQTVKIHGLDANKKLGQHFLLDLNVTDKIARLTLPLENASVAEIGPGPGGLTRSLFKAGAKHILAIEMDERFLVPLGDIADATTGQLDILNADALKVDIAEHLNGEIKIAANLPYNVGTKLLINWLLAKPLFWSQAVLMFQKEVAERVVARPGDSGYGRLAVLSQSICSCHMAFDVPARAFTPPPKVDSAVVVLEPLPADKRYAHLTKLGQVTQAAFGQRRKMLRRSLKSMAATHDTTAEAWLKTAGIASTRRPETLTPQEFHTLTNVLVS